jgi:hypothetical protein
MSVETTMLPKLEEALALTHGLTDIVHGRGDYNKETSVMGMLEFGTTMQTRSSASGSMHIVVEQLNQRCQLLESERNDLMEVTLDLIESARESNAAEIDAALATFRQNASQELMEVYQIA